MRSGTIHRILLGIDSDNDAGPPSKGMNFISVVQQKHGERKKKKPERTRLKIRLPLKFDGVARLEVSTMDTRHAVHLCAPDYWANTGTPKKCSDIPS
jgi:hypothetical protein